MLLSWLFVIFAAFPPLVLADDLPTVCVAILVRNKEHSLPFFLGALERLAYPKQRMSLWIILDHTVDNSQGILEKWLQVSRDLYRQVHYSPSPRPSSYPTQTSDTDWPEERMERMIILKTAAMEFARGADMDYLFYLDADVILMNPKTLNYLVSLKKTVVAPMLNSTKLYSNFWGGMNAKGYYERSDDYLPIRNRDKQGVLEVPLVYSAVLINLRDGRSQGLTFKRNKVPEAPFDELVIFGLSARQNGVTMHVANTDFFGYIPIPRKSDQGLEEEAEHFRELITSKTVLEFDGFIPEPFNLDVVPKSKLGFDEIYLINLVRRYDRAEKMKRLLRVFNVDYRHFPAVDGRLLNNTYLEQIGVKMLDGYLDPFHQRPLTMGEIGCFLSHYYIWKDMVKNNYQRILILEDDSFFHPNFNERIATAVSDADSLVPQWELMYAGRKILDWDAESYVYGSPNLVYPSYSYWTVSYALTLSGAKKLLDIEPLSKMVAVDEFLPIMFNRNSNVQWLHAFPRRDLIAVSVNPLLVEPQFFTAQDGYYSDTEASVLIEDKKPEPAGILPEQAQIEKVSHPEL